MIKRQLLYEPSVLEMALSPGYETPGKGFHTLHERELWFEEGKENYRGSVTYVAGGQNNGLRYTFVHLLLPGSPIPETGWASGFRLPVPARPLPPTLGKDIRGLEISGELLFPQEIPGFGPEEWAPSIPGGVCSYHEDGWYTISTLVREIPTPEVLGEGARVFLLREGVYVAFPDGTSRLAPYEDFFNFVTYGPNHETPRLAPIHRQGDLLVWEKFYPPVELELVGAGIEGPLIEMDRHEIRIPIGGSYCVRQEDGHTRVYCSDAVVSHPQHGDLQLQAETGGMFCLEQLPGTSRPFRREGGLD